MKLISSVAVIFIFFLGTAYAEPVRLACKFGGSSKPAKIVIDVDAGMLTFGALEFPIVFSSEQYVQASRVSDSRSKNVYSNTIIIDRFSGEIVVAFAGLSCLGTNCKTELNSNAQQGTCTRAVL